MPGEDRVYDAFQCGARGTHGREVPQHSQEGVAGHGEEVARDAPAHGPGEAGPPVAPCFEAGGVSRAQRSNHGDESLGHGTDGGGGPGRQAFQNRAIVATAPIYIRTALVSLLYM